MPTATKDEPDAAPGGAAYTGPMSKPLPVVVVLEPDPAHGQPDWSATIFPDGEAAAREFLAARTLVGWKHVHILPIPPQGATMTYIRELDPEYRPADLDNPFRCADCKWEGTWEDCDRVIDHYDSRETLGIICPSCRLVQWVDQEEPDGGPGPEYGTDDLAEINALRAEQGRRAL